MSNINLPLELVSELPGSQREKKKETRSLYIFLFSKEKIHKFIKTHKEVFFCFQFSRFVTWDLPVAVPVER